MTAKEKYPELWAKFQQLQVEKTKIEKLLEPFVKQREELLAQIQPVEAQIREINKKMQQFKPGLATLDRQISALARAMGGKSMDDAPKPAE